MNRKEFCKKLPGLPAAGLAVLPGMKLFANTKS